MLSAMKTHFATLALLLCLWPSAASAAGTWTAFGPETVVRGGGASTKVTRTFSILNRNTVYVLDIRPKISRPSQSSVVITLNGARVLSMPLSSWLPIFIWPVRVNSSNQLAIELKGPRDESVSVQVVGLDLDAPTIAAGIAPPPPASGWFTADPTVTFTCADKTSGVVSCTPPVVVASEGANQIIRGTVTDRAGHQASKAVAVSLDKTAPTITATRNPAPNEAGWNSGPVTVSFNCFDALSGIRSCPAAVLVSTPGTHVVNGVAIDAAGNQTTLATSVNISTSSFTLRNYGGKCLDGGSGLPGGTVSIKTCNGSAAQQFRVEEMNASHHVRLHVGSAVLGFAFDPTPVIDEPTLGSGVDEQVLKLQTPEDPAFLDVTGQLFSLDGDSIIAAADRNLVAQVENGRGADGTAVSLRKRKLADAEFWDFIAIDGSGRDPTTGFVRVETRCDLLRYLPLKVPGQPPEECQPGGPASPAGPGSVIQIGSGATLVLAGLYPIVISSEITIRGGRRGLTLGARLCKALDCNEDKPMDVPDSATFDIQGRDVRITGLRLEGPSRRTDPDVQTTRAVIANDRLEYTRTIIDHNDVSGWTGGGIDVVGPDGDDAAQPCTIEPPLSSNVFVARNFLHHNRQQEKGYGVVAGKGGFPRIEGNTFLANRHAIAAAGGPHNGYFAQFNLVLSEAPLQEVGPFNWRTHDFDQHGNGDNGFGERAGLYNGIFDNTFFGDNRANYEIRGHPCYRTDFGRNVTLQSAAGSVVFEPFMILPTQPPSEVVNFIDNHFNSSHPANRLGVGDFDGDGLEDLFLATGAAWYYSPGGAREWRFLSGNATPLSSLRFGDFDGDGRTDVITVSGARLWASWAGASDWDYLSDAPGPITDLAVGQFVSDFPGDRRDDLFWAEGFNWWVSSGGSALFQATQTSGKRVSELRFGDFDSDGLTDVFGIEDSRWKVSYGAMTIWTPLPVSLTDSVADLVVADFDGDGRADVGRATDLNVSFNLLKNVFLVDDWKFSVSSGGATAWQGHTITPTSTCSMTFSPAQLAGAGLSVGVANADGVGGTDLLLWGAKDTNNFCIVTNGTGAADRWSSQDMR